MMVTIVFVSAAILLVAYLVYGRILARLLRVDGRDETPANALRDDLDYVPLDRGPLMAQHFSAIAAAGPIVGPILAGAMFGWLPALIWILVGSIFIGGVHDFTALMASVRNRGLSIAEVVRKHMSHRSFVLFLAFIWFALVYIIVAFTDITAASFIGEQVLDNGEKVRGAAIASSSLMYLALPIIMGLLVRFTKLTMGWATVIFLPLVGIAIWGGRFVPLDLEAFLQHFGSLSETDANIQAHKLWDFALLIYCGIASLVPMWLLLQPRGQLGGIFLYAALGAGALGLLIGGQPVQLPRFIGWETASGVTLAPMLFITIACGACSGFHSLIASGTTSKQIRTELDARPIGYGTMLLEAMVAIVSLCCVMMIAQNDPLYANPKPNFIYARGIANFLEAVSIPQTLGVTFALMAFTTFVYDTLDVCARLGRYVIQELTGWHDARGKWLGTGITVAAPMFFILQDSVDASGNPIPIWRMFWSLFGASNQLLAALTLLGVTVWLWRTRRAMWVWFVTGLPMLFMFVMSNWALLTIIRDAYLKGEAWSAVTAVAALLVLLAVLMLVEAITVLSRTFGSPPADSGGLATNPTP